MPGYCLKVQEITDRMILKRSEILKLVLLSCPKPKQVEYKTKQFRRMLTALEHSGIEGKYFLFQKKKELVKILQSETPDLVFSTDYYTKNDSNEKLNIQEVFDDLHIPYIGSDPGALELVLSKGALKKKWILQDIPTPAFFTIRKSGSKILGLENLIHAAGYPYILKPNADGNSHGLDEHSIVFDRKSLKAKLRELLKTYNEVIIEKYLGIHPDIREYTVAMIGNGDHKLLMPARITLKKKKSLRIVTTHDKDDHLTQANAVSDKKLKKRLVRFSEKAFKAAGVRDYSRCDILLANKRLYAIEINGQPMIPDKWFTECAKGAHLNTEQYINAIVLSALVRNNQKRKAVLPIPGKLRQSLPPKVYRELMAN